MRKRRLGKTGLMVSEIGFGAEWMVDKTPEEVREFTDACSRAGINVLDCWMAGPEVRSALGRALEGVRDRWIVQGHIGSVWQDGQYVRTREMDKVVPAFEDLLERLGTDHVELGMIHFVDSVEEFDSIMDGEFYRYVEELLREGTIEHVGLSTHNPEVAMRAVESGKIESIMFSLNPAFDLLPASEDIEDLFGEYDDSLQGMDPLRERLYMECERADVGLTVMKGYAGGRLLDAATSPFGVALTAVQCLHYALTRPAVASVMAGFGELSHVADAVAYETASEEELDYASVLAGAPRHAYFGQCTYCGHCAPCPAGIDVAMANKYFDLATLHEEVPESVRSHYGEMRAVASDCTGCRACEERCPFGVHVAERMAEMADLFGR